MAKQTELLFIPSPGIGHLVSTIELAKRLIDRDDRFSITIIVMKLPSTPKISAYIESLVASIAEKIHFIDLPEQLELPSPEIAQSPESVISIFIENHKPHVKNTITKLYSSQCGSKNTRLAGLVIDLFCTTMIDLGNELGIPSYLFITNSAGVLGLMLHLPNLHTQITTDFKDSDGELIIPCFLNQVPPLVLPMPLWIKKDDGYTWYIYHGRRFREAKGIIINTFSELEPHAVNSFSDCQLPPVYPVGPLLDLQGQLQRQSDQTQFENIKKWLDNQPPSSVIFLCFGSLGSFGAAQVKEIAVGLERSGHRFLWSLRQPAKAVLTLPTDYTNHREILPEGFLERTQGRGLVCGWVPQVDVLSHQAIGGFVSHCGWNSILESLWFGVPIAAWPLYAEQHLNAFEMVRELGGLAVELRLDYRNGNDLVTAEEVEKGVRSVMEVDCEVRRRVKEMGEKSREAVMDGGSSFTSLGRLIEDMMDENPWGKDQYETRLNS